MVSKLSKSNHPHSGENGHLSFDGAACEAEGEVTLSRDQHLKLYLRPGANGFSIRSIYLNSNVKTVPPISTVLKHV